MERQLSFGAFWERYPARPFVKWVGGKGQLLEELISRLPQEIKKKGIIDQYIEPFVGGGALFFRLQREYELKRVHLIDINRELMVGYRAIKEDYQSLISLLREIEEKYHKMKDEERKEYYYQLRDEYNQQMESFDYHNFTREWVSRAALLIFLNRTGFNGLFRQNKKGEFNVPHGRYKQPKICDEENIELVSRALQRVELHCDSFTAARDFIDHRTLVYFDPPYRPLNKTSSFTSYFKENFDDQDQRLLASFFSEMDDRGAWLMLSNSDPRNEDPEDDFFDRLYQDYLIERVEAKRYVNRNPEGRGPINELLIRNYS